MGIRSEVWFKKQQLAGFENEFLEFKPSLSLSSAFSISKILFFSSSFATFCSKFLHNSTILINN